MKVYPAIKDGLLKSYNVLGVVLLFLAFCMYFGKYGQCTDTKEVQYMLKTFGVAGTIAAAIMLLISYFNEIDLKVRYFLSMFLSYFLAAFLIYAAFRLLNGFNFLFSYGFLEEKIIDVHDRSLYGALMSHLPLLQKVMGITLLVISAFIILRNTRWLAALVLLPLMILQLAMQLSLETCSSAYFLLLTSIPLYLVLQESTWFISSVMRNQPIKKSYPFFNNQKIYEGSIFLKIMFFVGILVYTHFKHQRFSGYIHATPISGVWKIDKTNLKPGDNNDLKSFFNAESLFFETGKEAYIKNEDGLTRFKYLLDSSQRQFEMYDFHEFRELDFKGRYDIINQDTLIFEGKNNKDSLNIKFIKDHSYERLKPFDEEYTPTDYQFYLKR